MPARLGQSAYRQDHKAAAGAHLPQPAGGVQPSLQPYSISGCLPVSDLQPPVGAGGAGTNWKAEQPYSAQVPEAATEQQVQSTSSMHRLDPTLLSSRKLRVRIHL